MEEQLQVPNRSILTLFPGECRASLLADTIVLRCEAGESVSRQDAPDAVFLVLEGQIALIGAGGKEVGEAGIGEALELGAFLKAEPSWHYQWVARASSRILRIPGEALSAAFRQFPDVRVYLDAVEGHPELKRFRDELFLLGMSDVQLMQTIPRLASRRFPEFEESGDSAAVGIVVPKFGRITLSKVEKESDKLIGHFYRGDCFVWDGNRRLLCSFEEGTEFWWLDSLTWSRAVRSDKIAFHLRMLDVVAHKLRIRADLATMRSRSAGPEGARKDPNEPVDSESSLDDFPRAKRRRRPSCVRQLSFMDCGAACLASVAGYYGRRIGLRRFRDLIGVDREGGSLLDLREAARSVGFAADGFSLDMDELGSVTLPMVAVMDYHFVVVYRVTPKGVLIADPGRGLHWQSRAEFEEDWSSFGLLLKPTERFAANRNAARSLGKYFQSARECRTELALLLLGALLVFALGLAPTVLLQQVFDTVVADRHSGMLGILGSSTVAITLVWAAALWGQGVIARETATRQQAKFSSLIAAHMFKLPMSVFSARAVTDLTQPFREVITLGEELSIFGIELLMGAITAACYLVLLFFYDWHLFALMIGLIAFMGGFLHWFGGVLRDAYRSADGSHMKAAGIIWESLEASRTIQSIGAAVAARWRWGEKLEQAVRCRNRQALAASVASATGGLFQELFALFMLLAASIIYFRGRLTLGQVVAINGFVASIAVPFTLLFNRYNEITEATIRLLRIDELIEEPAEKSARPVSVSPPKELEGRIQFVDVCFKYGGVAAPMTLNGVSLEILPGQTVAFVGPSGSGKTTLGYLVNLLYRPSHGEILLDGKRATDFPLEWLRSQIAVVSQENHLLSGSILENIALGDPSPSLARVTRAAMLATADEFIERKPEGYGTVLGHAGSGLSGGQKQKINLARALYRLPRILILDEATSAMDALSEAAIMRNLSERVESAGVRQTKLIIAHRLNTVVHADRIYVLNRGKIVETGTHEELIFQDGLYCELFRNQMAMD